MGSTVVGKIWCLASCLSSIFSAVGYCYPYWLEGSFISGSGEIVTINFGLFRRCTYPQAGENEAISDFDNCERYGGFLDIPSVSWKACTVIIGVGTCLSLLVAVSGILSLCLSDHVTVMVTRAAGILQLSAGILTTTGVTIYPSGWNTQPVAQACGPLSGAYLLGDCSLHWALYMTAAGGAITTICSVFTCHAFKGKSYRTSYDV